MITTVSVLAVVFVSVVILAQRHTYVLQYLFFCRFPMLIALLMALVLPWGMCSWARTSLGNLAILEPRYVGLVAFVVTLAAWAILLTTTRMFLWVPRYSDLFFYREESAPKIGSIFEHPLVWAQAVSERIVGFSYQAILGNAEPGAIYPRRLLMYFLLAAPLITVTVVRSTQESGRLGANLAMALVGVVVAVGVRILGAQLTRLMSKIALTWGEDGPVRRRVKKFVNELDKVKPTGFCRTGMDVTQDVLIARTTEGIGFFGFVGLVFLLVGYFLSPARSAAGPALPIIIMALLVILFLFSLASSFLDKLRVPVIVVFLVFTFVLYQVFERDHYYEVLAPPVVEQPETGEKMTPRRLFQVWRQTNPPDRATTPVIVATSGGGISASLWTAKVLTQLSSTVSSFDRSLIAISSVSGGGVGAMFFLDQFKCGRPPKKSSMELIRSRAGSSSLLATTWGFAYRDIWWSLPLWKTNDRGLALERSWERRLDSGDLTLGNLESDLAERWRPIQIFNATTVETGERFLLMPMRLRPDDENIRSVPDHSVGADSWNVRNFLDLYSESDLKIVTAARLSATFPFVSPNSRPQPDETPDREVFHLADGGYFDNHGVVTAVDLLRDLLPIVEAEQSGSAETGDQVNGGTPRVVLVQIRVEGQQEKEPDGGSGYLAATIGPMQTLMNVRTASQVGRNRLEVELLKESWADRVKLESYEFVLDLPDAPLSWHLSKSERALIENGWTATHRELARKMSDAIGL